eukprot:scaffold5297_cov108-Skeletonema_marinoi.AAC.4
MEEGSTVMLLLLDAPTMPSLEEFVGVIEQSSKSKMQQGRLRQSIKEEERRTLLQCSHWEKKYRAEELTAESEVAVPVPVPVPALPYLL